MPLPDRVANQRIGSHGEGVDGNQQNHVEATHDIGDSQRPHTEMLHHDKEHEVGGQGDEVLQHREDRDGEDLPQRVETEPTETVESIFPIINTHKRIDHKEEHGDRLRHDRCDRCPLDA